MMWFWIFLGVCFVLGAADDSGSDEDLFLAWWFLR